MSAPLFDREMEKAVLGGLLRFPEMLPDAVAEGVTGNTFVAPDHRKTFEAMIRLGAGRLAEGSNVALAQELKSTDDLGVAGGPVGLATLLVMAFTTAANLRAGWHRLLELHRARIERPEDVGALDGDPQQARITIMSTVTPQTVRWLWPAWIPRGMLVIVEGDPGEGKSTLTLDLAARVSRGAKMPDGTGGGTASGAVILSAEDDLAAVIVPRLSAAGADLKRIATVHIKVTEREERDPLVETDDLLCVEAAIRRVNAALLVVDPLVSYLPDSVNTDRDHSVRRALWLLKDLAERTGCSVLVVRHWRKSETPNVLYRGGGSIGIIAAARAGLVVARDPEDMERRVLAVSKSNLAPIPSALAFRLASEEGRACPRVVWDGPCSYTAAGLTVAATTEEGRGAMQEAVEFLRDTLSDGPVPHAQLIAQARKFGVSDITLRRAKARLGIRAAKVGGRGGEQRWEWRLPDEGAHSTGKGLKVLRGAQDERLHLSPGGNSLCDGENVEGAHSTTPEHLQGASRPGEDPFTPAVPGLEPGPGWESSATVCETVTLDEFFNAILVEGREGSFYVKAGDDVAPDPSRSSLDAVPDADAVEEPDAVPDVPLALLDAHGWVPPEGGGSDV